MSKKVTKNETKVVALNEKQVIFLRVLKEAGKPMTLREINAYARDKGYLSADDEIKNGSINSLAKRGLSANLGKVEQETVKVSLVTSYGVGDKLTDEILANGKYISHPDEADTADADAE